MDHIYLKEKIGLSDAECGIIEELGLHITDFANLTGSDIFLDCFLSEKEGIVVFHGRPKNSLYKRNIEGEKVLPKNEPTVFYTMETGVGMSDAFAVSQENVVVQQKTSPVHGDKGRLIGVLIQESDVTDTARLTDKLNQMQNVTERLSSRELVSEGVTDINSEAGEKSILIQETHHRIKNNLQTISSILNIQRRRTANVETKNVLTDNISRINSLASMHEIMMTSSTEDIDMCEALKKQVELFERIHDGAEKNICFDFEGQTLVLSFEKAQALSMIVNELMVNAVKHGFRNRNTGNVRVRLMAGATRGTAIVFNDGEEMSEASERREGRDTGLGLDIVKGLTEDKLKGNFSIESSSKGTAVKVSFPI